MAPPEAPCDTTGAEPTPGWTGRARATDGHLSVFEDLVHHVDGEDVVVPTKSWVELLEIAARQRKTIQILRTCVDRMNARARAPVH